MRTHLTPRRGSLFLATLAASLVAGCANLAPFSQEALPGAVQVPAGHSVAAEWVGMGDITYECRAQPNNAGFAWVFVGPEASLNDRHGKKAGRYFGPPATWESTDGSKVTGTQVAIAPAAAGSIPFQLVKANPATNKGALVGVTFIQRVATRGGVAPAAVCDAGTVGKKQVVPYQADYIFYKAK
jgi:hypothetical protein